MAEALKGIDADKKRRLVSNVIVINVVYCYMQSADVTNPPPKTGALAKPMPTVPDDHEIYQEVTEGLLLKRCFHIFNVISHRND